MSPDHDMAERVEDPEPLPAVVYGTVTLHLCDPSDSTEQAGGEPSPH